MERFIESRHQRDCIPVFGIDGRELRRNQQGWLGV